MANDNKSDQRVVFEKFVTVMQQVYSSNLDEKMRLTFDMFDFDNDGKISAEDVKLVLSYIPYRNQSSSAMSVEDSSSERDGVKSLI